MIGLLQINLRKSGPARRLMEQTPRELGVNLLILSEIPRGPPDSPGWVSSGNGKSAIALSSTARMAAIECGRGLSFAWMLFPGLLVYSCYW